MVWYGHYDVVQYGMVGIWYGMARCGVVSCGMVWYQCGMVSNYKTVYLELSFQYL